METPTEFLQRLNIVAEDKTDLIIGFDNGTEVSLIKLLDEYSIIRYQKGFQDACSNIAGRIAEVAKLDPLI